MNLFSQLLYLRLETSQMQSLAQPCHTLLVIFVKLFLLTGRINEHEPSAAVRTDYDILENAPSQGEA